jgi:glycosyltransferase involved in cell wall biosynthesis
VSEKSRSGWPRITVLTPCFNAERYIAEAVESVRCQDYPDLEHIVLDATSTDRSLEILAGFTSCRVLSEPDQGSHDAMNKGLRLATGEIVGFLNTDDAYADGLLVEVGRTFANDPALDVVVVGTVVFEETESGGRRTLVARDHRIDDGFWLAELAFGAPGFNGRFFRRRVFDRLGGFDLAYDFSADRHFLIRIALSGVKTLTLPRFGYFFRSHPASRTLDATRRNAVAFAREHIRQALAFARDIHDDPTKRRVFLAWHAFDSAKLACFELKAHGLTAALAAALRLTRDNPAWLTRLPAALSMRYAVRKAETDSTAAFAAAR